jgi:hypothetical protein
MEFSRHGYCGLYCGACPVLLASENGELEALAQSFKMSADDLRCYGCKSDTVAVFCRECKMKNCAQQKQYEFCHQCADLPCQDLITFTNDERYPYHPLVLKNLAAIRQHDLDAWLQAQDQRWRCSVCGTKFAWRDEVCRKCGEPVASYKADL